MEFEEKTSPQKPTKDYLKEVFDFVELFAIAACIILLLFTLLARLTVVEGGSMESTLSGGDRLIVSGLFYKPEGGDIVVIQQPNIDDGKAIVKRVIATEGQTVEIKNDGVYVYNPDGSGGKLEETNGSMHYTVDFSPYSIYNYSYSPMKVTVGEGEVFVMGDHRSVSLDSRYFGCVDKRCIVGKVYLRVAPLSAFGIVE